MNFADMQAVIDEADRTQRIVDQHVNVLIRLISGRLRAAGNPGYWSRERTALASLKRELRDFDTRTGRWK